MQPSNQESLDESIDENVPWLLIGIPSRDPLLAKEYLQRHSESSGSQAEISG